MALTTVALSAFTVAIGEKDKKYRFLRQGNAHSESSNRYYFLVGQQQTGVIYFEDDQLAYGTFRPVIRNKMTKIRLLLIDSFGRKHVTKLSIPELEIEQARRFGDHVGATMAAIRDAPGTEST